MDSRVLYERGVRTLRVSLLGGCLYTPLVIVGSRLGTDLPLYGPCVSKRLVHQHSLTRFNTGDGGSLSFCVACFPARVLRLDVRVQKLIVDFPCFFFATLLAVQILLLFFSSRRARKRTKSPVTGRQLEDGIPVHRLRLYFVLQEKTVDKLFWPAVK